MVQHRKKDNEQKAAEIAKWIDPNERITIQFDCTDHLVSLSLDTTVPHIRQHVSLPLNSVEVSEDLSHYTRDPEGPLTRKRMMLIVQGECPAVIY